MRIDRVNCSFTLDNPPCCTVQYRIWRRVAPYHAVRCRIRCEGTFSLFSQLL